MTRPLERRRRPRGSGSARQRAPGKWELRYLDATKTVLAKNRTEASLLLNEFVELVRNGGVSRGKRLTFNDAADEYLKTKERSKSPTTVAWYRRNLAQHVRPVIGKITLDEIRKAHVEKVLDDARNGSRTKRKGERLGRTTERNLLIAVRAVLAWAVKEGYVLTNVAKRVDLPPEENVERAVLDVPSVKAVLDAVCNTELEPIVVTAIGTGLRRSEICGLRWSDVTLDEASIRVNRAAVLIERKIVYKAPKTARSRRSDHLPAFVVAVLRRHRVAQAQRHLALGIGSKTDALVFTRLNGGPWNPNELSKQFSRFVRLNPGLPRLRFHDLRHGFASLAFAAGVPLRVVSESLGHAGIAITAKTYVHLLDEQKRDKSERLDAYLGAAVRPTNEARSAS